MSELWTQHLSDDRLIGRLYGTDPEARLAEDAHLEDCRECARRWGVLQRERARVLGDLPEDFALWNEQRRRVLERAESGEAEPASNWARAWATAGFSAAFLAAGLWFYVPQDPLAAPVPAAAVDVSDPGWYEETYSVMEPDEPRAAGPIRVLFEQKEEEQVTE